MTYEQDQSPTRWREAVTQYIRAHPDRPLKVRALARELDVPDDAYVDFRHFVRRMVSEGVLAFGPRRTLVLGEHTETVSGIFRPTRRGFGFVETPGHADIYIPRGQTAHARDGDEVEVRIVRAGGKSSLGPRGTITRIVERADVHWVGVLERVGPRYIVRPQGKAPAPVVEIDDPHAKSAQVGDLVVVEPLQEAIDTRRVRGVIVEKLGPPDQTQIRVLGVMRRYSLPDEFPGEVRGLAQETAAAFADDTPDCPAGREDLRDRMTLTIDPADARDFDDAISISRSDGGHWELGVHIADVSHFVPLDGAVDAEARQRGNSVYFPGRVVPMLPEVLSNGVCSLQPERTRFTKSVFIEYDQSGRVQGTRVANSVIRSDARLTYEQASGALQGKADGLPSAVVDLLKQAEQLARAIRKRRIREGMIVLTLPDVEFTIGADGVVEDSGPADTSFSHTIIEMFMVEANEAVCRTLHDAELPHLRRIHPDPEPDASAVLSQVLAGLGYQLPEEVDRDAILALLDRVRGKPEEPAVNFLLLRCMSQACYSPAPEGHFALASRHYCHFTSPIRRYPDLVVHRALDAYLGTVDGPSAEDLPSDGGLAELGRHTSSTERVAQEAEREVKNLLLLQLMKGKVGEVFDGIVTGIASFGVFVQVKPHLAEGLVRLRDLGPDVWEFEDKTSQMHGRHSSRTITIGERVRVQVAAVDELRQELDLVPAESSGFGRVRRRAGRTERRKTKGAAKRGLKRSGSKRKGPKRRARRR